MIKRSLGIFLLVALMVTSCSRKKNTSLSRAYHNTTSRYNGYFNARELMKEQEENLRTIIKEDYSQRLPIFIYPNEAQSQTMYPDMDKVIEKCSEVIERHSIYKRGKEYIKWIDDSYYLIGKARLYKQEYGLAESTFLYVYQNYKKDPARYNGLNWLIKTFIETEQWDRAEDFLDIAEDNLKKYPEEHIGHYHAIYADYNIKRDQDFEKAIENLEKAIELTKEKEARRRYTYILAQLHLKDNNLLLATERFSEVLKMNPDYTMRFNARISRAIAYDVKGSSDGKAIKKELNKMLKDIKNEEFKDQIYYALAEVALKEQDKPLAISYLKKSTKFSVSNTKQKALSYLRLADIYFEQPSYILAQEHYDSTLQFLPENHPEYYPTEEKNNSLQDLVKNLKTIQLQDSLLALSNLGTKDREKKVEKIIEQLKAEEERKKQAELQKLRDAQNQATSGLINVAGGRGKGQWYFYNPNTASIGLSNFKNTWGGIVLEDNWRRKNKASSSAIAQNTPANDSLAKIDSAFQKEKYNPEFYLKDIPKNYEEQLAAHGKISEALFNVGTIFKESFIDYTSAINAFERVTKEYDTSKFNLPSHYQLYRIYKINEYEEKAEVEKKWVLDNHPFSEYAYLIKNPNYSKQSKETKEKVEEFYAATYKLYKYGLYNDVISSCEKADQTFSTNHLKAKFDLLRAQSIGNSKSKIVYKEALEAVVKDHPKTPEQQKASEILVFLNQNAPPPAQKEKTSSAYKHNPKSKHIFVISAKVNKSSNFSILRNKLSDFNKQYFRESGLTVTQSALNSKSIYLVRTFDNEELAIRYIKALENNSQLSSIITQFNAKQYIISNENFRTLFRNKDENAYLSFYNKEYAI